MTQDRPVEDAGALLRKVMASSRFAKPRQAAAEPPAARLTALGAPLTRQEDGRCVVDMTRVRVFSGVAGFAQFMAAQVVEQVQSSPADVSVQQVVSHESTPELAALGVGRAVLHARAAVARVVAARPQELLRHLQLAFEAIQGPAWGGLLFPAAFGQPLPPEPSAPPALLFPFHAASPEESPHLLLEYEPEGRFLRATLEDGSSRLNLRRIPHRVVAGFESRRFFDVESIASQISRDIQRECQNQQDQCVEAPSRQPELFGLLTASALPALVSLKLRWSLEDMSALTPEPARDLQPLIAKTLLLLEDEDLLATLAQGVLVEMIAGKRQVFLDVSQGGACLNVSLGRPRQPASIQDHLVRQPNLHALAMNSPRALKGFRILLIHHVTSEVLGLINALDRMGCAAISTLFIRYKGIVPGEHLEALLSLPRDRFSFHALQKTGAPGSVEGAHVLSRQYSPIDGLELLDERLRHTRAGFLTAMRQTALHLLFREAAAAQRLGQKLLLVEDGGYLAPLLNEACLEGETVGQFLDRMGMSNSIAPQDAPAQTALDLPLRRWLQPVFPGSVEHTRNGHDQIARVQSQFGGLAFPAVSIACSTLKDTEEAAECSLSILNAVETVFHSMGRLLSNRRVMVIGSRGHIGGHLMANLSGRVRHGSLCGVDIALGVSVAQRPATDARAACVEARTPQDLPDEALLATDLVIGCAGVSVLRPETIERLVLHGGAPVISFASGSTKTVEFAGLTQWLQQLRDAPSPRLAGFPARVDISPLRDPQTGLIQGDSVRLTIDRPGAPLIKTLLLLGDLMPINFLYYGVPTEVIDCVMTQLARLVAGFARTVEESCPLPAALLAVDHDIDADARPLKSP